MGKDWSHAGQLFTLYEVDNPKEVMRLAKMYERICMNHYQEKALAEQKRQEKKSKSGGGGKNYTHNVRG